MRKKNNTTNNKNAKWRTTTNQVLISLNTHVYWFDSYHHNNIRLVIQKIFTGHKSHRMNSNSNTWGIRTIAKSYCGLTSATEQDIIGFMQLNGINYIVSEKTRHFIFNYCITLFFQTCSKSHHLYIKCSRCLPPARIQRLDTSIMSPTTLSIKCYWDCSLILDATSQFVDIRYLGTRWRWTFPACSVNKM